MNVTKLNDRDPDRGQRDAALLSLAITLVLAAVLYVALFDVETALEHVVLAVVVVIALAAAAFVHVSATPTRRLPDPEKVRREQRHAAMLTGVLGAVLLRLTPRVRSELVGRSGPSSPSSWRSRAVRGSRCKRACAERRTAVPDVLRSTGTTRPSDRSSSRWRPTLP